MSDMLPPTLQFLASPDTPGPESPGRPLVAKIPGSHPPPGGSAALETIAQSLFSHDLRHRQLRPPVPGIPGDWSLDLPAQTGTPAGRKPWIVGESRCG